ncbi:pyrimidine-nucleoside phosphorylase/thymidine phosphorylase [Mycoplasma testudineum]|uniref:Pyrimidine-nucleoside phosphorylase/thymidine phosphorylase n=1 Tax=Mycoplasma testudineum TaxID=244584 RepID=A0A4R6IH48_9MOLU|nr:thymidine phosphorylase [Mycoplasma testudineum]OYD27075.1 thymidine phosphorylase [Mycoplasma testudineum]TDO21171.1 pyrimidine-nucleoside phosphorylase/thymidine phosphorylase [Mycoplasma testudineum]
MDFNIVSLIEKKFQNQELSKDEINFIVNGFVDKRIKDYQMSSLLMAIRFNGMNDEELTHLTMAMMYSGSILDLSDISGIKVDKHSTGGVGDKISLILGPILAACGVKFAKMSGRGLGHTGGTIDKLESINNFSISLSDNDFKNQVNKINMAIIGQDEKLVPADKLIYALRDVTGTVNSIPLIASSIMSKKLATGSDKILLDVKVGKGAFMKTIKSARELGKRMIAIGKLLNREVRVEITNMDRPLGRAIGNKNEVLEAIQTLQGHYANDIKTIIYSSAATLLIMAQKAKTQGEAITLIEKVIRQGSALDSFKNFIEAQGGNFEEITQDKWWNPKYSLDIKADKQGYLVIKDALAFGITALELGAGRHTKEDILDNEAGIWFNKQTNDVVQKDDVLFTLYSSKPIPNSITNLFKGAYSLEDKQVANTIIFEQLK